MANIGLKAQTQEQFGYKVLYLSGEIDIYTQPLFRQSVKEVIDITENYLVLDMHDISYMDSSGLTVLVSAATQLNPLDGQVILVGCKPHLIRILDITSINTMVVLYNDLASALTALGFTSS